MNTQLFTRERSTAFTLQASDPGAKKHFGWVRRMCGRCGGSGKLDCYRHVEGGICFKCEGARYLPDALVPLYTAEELDKLDAKRAKAAATKLAKVQAKAEAARIAREAAKAERAAAIVSNPVFIRLNAFAGRSEFVAKIAETLRAQDLTEAQETAALAACDKIEADDARKAASAYVGTVGERLKGSVTIESAKCLHVAEGYWDQDRWLVKLRTAEGFGLTWFTSVRPYEDGTKLTGSFTVKAHQEYKGEKSTLIKNPRFK